MGNFNYKRIVVKVGSSTLTHESGRLNLERIEKLARVLSDLKNRALEIIIVSSGAVSAGRSQIGFGTKSATTAEKQALAAVGQSQLMKIYDRFFSDYGHSVAQILLTKDVVDSPVRFELAARTFAKLLEFGCVPIVNENDSVSSVEIEFGGNDTLSAYVAQVCGADLLINLSDIDSLYDCDPRQNENARRIARVDKITPEILALGGGAGTSRGTGGMRTKLEAANLASSAGIPMIIADGTNPTILYDIFEGKAVGTFFAANKLF